MDELISQKALIKALDYARLHNIGVRDAVKSVPTVDAVKVVRCKDCASMGTVECPTDEERRVVVWE